MSKFIVNSKPLLKGVVNVSGSKNAALPILAATLLTGGLSQLSNVPELTDIEVMTDILKVLGCNVEKREELLCIDSENVKPCPAPYELTGRIRASFLVAGPLLARFGKARVALPGGCAIGTRPVDLHIKGFKALGAKCDIQDGYVDISSKKLIGNRIYLDFPSVGATQNILMASVLARGETVIENCASEPEITDLIHFLNSCGAVISGAGTDKIVVCGVKSLNGAVHRIIPDRIEAGTFMLATAATGGTVKINDVVPSHLSAITSKLCEIGAEITEFDSEILVKANGLKKGTDIKTMPFPGFPTDMQSQFAALLCAVRGTSVITETVFENRFMYIPELVRMNADIKVDGRTAVINGTGRLMGARVRATDLRAGAALVIAGLCADGKTVIEDADYIKRGYSNLQTKLKNLGADVSEEIES